MRLTKKYLPVFIVATSAIVAGFGERCCAGNFAYTNFDSTAGLILKENAGLVQKKLRITPAIPGLGKGGVWLEKKQPVQNGFETTFQIQITEKHSSGADGLAFVIQNTPVPRVGRAGHGLGYTGVTNEFVVHFNNYHWEEHPTRGNYDDIAVLTDPDPALPLENVTNNVIALVDKNIVYSDGAVHTVKIVYVPGTLEIFLDDLENPVIKVTVDVSEVMALENGTAWVGFTAASGSDWQAHDLVSWTFSSPDVSIAGASHEAVISPAVESITPTQSAVTVYQADAAAISAATPLSHDPAFGFALPQDTALTHGIEVSTNLVHWTPVTNAHYYFRDVESTNYPQRFYRFPKN